MLMRMLMRTRRRKRLSRRKVWMTVWSEGTGVVVMWSLIKIR